MSYKVKVVGILKANGQLANYGDVLEETDLIDAFASLREGYVEEVKLKKDSSESKPADAPLDSDQNTPADASVDKSGNNLIDQAKAKAK